MAHKPNNTQEESSTEDTLEFLKAIQQYYNKQTGLTVGYCISVDPSGKYKAEPITAKEFYLPKEEDTVPIGTEPMSLYPTMGTLQEAIDLAESKLPINHKNDLVGMLYTYHNTLLKVLSK